MPKNHTMSAYFTYMQTLQENMSPLKHIGYVAKSTADWPVSFELRWRRRSHGRMAQRQNISHRRYRWACCRWNVYATFSSPPQTDQSATSWGVTVVDAGVCGHGVNIFHGYADDTGERVTVETYRLRFQAWRRPTNQRRAETQPTPPAL